MRSYIQAELLIFSFARGVVHIPVGCARSAFSRLKKMTRGKKKMAKIFTCLALLLTLLGPLPLNAAPAQKVAVLPFGLMAPQQMEYLVEGVRTMLASRLATGDGVTLVERAAVEQGMAAAGKPAKPADYAQLAAKLGADYLIGGSITALGGGVSLDAQVYERAGGPSQRFFATAASEGEIIPAVDQLAREIAGKVLGAGGVAAPATPTAPTTPTAPSVQQPAYVSAHPDRVLYGGSGGRSPFIRPMGVSSVLGFTKSQNLPIGLHTMEVGDLTGDGEMEFVLAGANQIHIYRREMGRFIKIGQVNTLTRYVIHYVSLADINNNGRAEIYVSAADYEDPASLALEWDGKQFVKLFDQERWYIRAMSLPGEGEVLCGQKSGITTFITPGITRLYYGEDGRLQTGTPVSVPPRLNLFDFTFVDVDNDGLDEIITISQDDRLEVLNRGGKLLWRSDAYYGGTTRFLGGRNPEKDDPYIDDKTPRYYIPARLAIRDINLDGQPDIVVVKNISASSRLFANMRSFPAGEVHALTWDGVGMTELWRTRKIDGYVADLQLGKDITIPPPEGSNEAAKPGTELFVGVVLRSGGLNIMTATESTILIYPLTYEKAKGNER